MVRRRTLPLAIALLLIAAIDASAQAIAYRLTFPQREHRLMNVEVTFTGVPTGTLQLRMSRSSPGRYAVHEFAKNVFDVRVTDGSTRSLPVTRPNPHQWDVAGHRGVVRVTYTIFGDRVDGTYLAVDSTHAHVNMPAALMWARGLEQRPVTVRFEPPAGTQWRVATQLFPGEDAHTFTAPNLQYLLDSPSEFSAFALRTFTLADAGRQPEFRVSVHHTGSDAEVDAFARDVEAIVRETRPVFGEFPAFDGNTYTFIADYVPWANGDGMEHRNSTILTSNASIATRRTGLLGTVAHEFFHAWNVERIRPRSLEPFNFEDANISDELWFAEGFTQYYGPLLTMRAGVTTVREFATSITGTLDPVLTRPGRLLHSAVDMSRMAPFTDAATALDRTAFDNTFISYYGYGAAIALGLDLTLRERTGHRVTLDSYMRRLWERYGRSGGARPGYVERPYTMADLKSALADVAGDRQFADTFFARYVEGREVADYPRLLALAGFVVRPAAAGRAWIGDVRFSDGANGLRVANAVLFGSPAYEAGLERDDLILSIGGTAVAKADEVTKAILARKPGDTLAIEFDRRGERVAATIKLIEDQHREVVPVETTGQTLPPAQQQFRNAWLRSRQTERALN